MRRPKFSDNNISGPWDVVVIGAGAAGLMACLELPPQLNVLLLNRNTSRRSSSRWAQGGIAAVTRPEDSFDSHFEDTINAGAGICDADAVELLVHEAPACVRRLQSLGMEFDRDLDQLATTLEAAHTFKRVLHVQDQTGRALIEVLQDRIEKRPNLLHKRGVRVTQLWVENNRCLGVQVLDGAFLHWIPAKAIVLATGGGGHLYANTTNPAQACGEGLVLAWYAGAAVEDLEFVQFHPTALKLSGAPCFLISEALRGEGAQLFDQQGRSPVRYLKGRDLASRDQVSRALVQAMQSQGLEHLMLQLQKIPPEKIETRFPTILQRCREFGLDPLRQGIPVAPAAHYWMGGVATDLKAATSVSGLYAVGEVACTGLHGANRLASNSLMECLVFARQLSSIELEPFPKCIEPVNEISLDCSLELEGGLNADELIRAIEDLRELCWLEGGVSRTKKGMQTALHAIRKSSDEIMRQPLVRLVNEQPKEISYHFEDSARRNVNLLLDLSHRQLASSLLFKACLFRKESRGGHFRTDAPKSMPFWKCHSRQTISDGIFTRPVKK